MYTTLYTNKNNDDNKETKHTTLEMDMDYNGMVFDKLFAPFVRQ